MKSKKLYSLAECANFIMVYLFFITLTEMWEMLLKRPFNLILPIGILLLLLFSYFVRVVFNHVTHFFDNILFYSLAHLIVFAIIIFIPIDVQFRLVFFVMFGYFFMCDLRCWFVNRGDTFRYLNIGFVIAPAIGYLVADIMHLKFSMTYFFVVGVIFIAMIYFRMFFENAYMLAVEKRNNDKMPLEDMLRNDSKLAIPFVVISFLIMIVARFDVLDKISLFIYLKFARLLGFLIVKGLAVLEIIYDFLFGEVEEMPAADLSMFDEELLEGNPIINTIANVLYVLIVLFFMFLVVKIIIALVKAAIEKKEARVQTFRDEDMIEIREKIVKKKKVKKDKLSKIRKQYKKTVERNMKKGYELKKYQTPRERADDIMQLMNEDISELNVLYENERYGHYYDN